MAGPPTLPSFNLPPQVLPDVPNLPRPNLDLPKADLPSYKPMLVPSKELMTLEGTKSEEEEKNEGKPVSKDLKKVTIPWTDYEMTVPREEILGAASISAVVSVATTLVATSVLKYATKIVKPVVQQILSRIYKKFTNGRKTQEPSK